MKVDEALTLAKTTRAALPEEKIALPAVLQNCKTICRYLDRLDNNKWIDYELNGYPLSLAGDEDNEYGIPNYRMAHQILFDEYRRPIQISSDLAPLFEKVPLRHSVVEILQYKTDGLIIPKSPASEKLNDPKFRAELNIHDAAQVAYGLISNGQIARIIYGIQDKIYDFLDNLILELEYGKVPETIFETIRKEADKKFLELCPDAIKKLILIYEQLNSNNDVVYSQIAGTCRQIINDVADSLYPPNSQSRKDDSRIGLNNFQYLNRLSVGIKSNSEKNIFKSMFKYTIQFLHEINSYASKGDHSFFQKSDAIRCVVYTYILLGDILHYYANDSMSTK